MFQHAIHELEIGLAEIPILDIHTHLVGGKLSARGLHDLLLYHMLISDLYAAGCPQGSRLTEYPGWPTKEESQTRIQQAIPYLPYIQNTSMFWMLRRILSDLYEWNEPLTEHNWRTLDNVIRERADDRSWQYSVLDRANIKRSVTELARRGSGDDDGRLQYALEWGFFTRSQWGEYDTAVFELERCWGRQPESPLPVHGVERQHPLHTINQIEDIHAAVEYYVETIPYPMALASTTHISTDIDYQLVSDQEMQSALNNRGHAGIHERNIYASYVNETFLTSLERYADQIVFQFSFGAEPLPYETGSRLSQRTIAQLADMISRHPKLHFQCLLANRHTNQSLCTLARELPNFSLAGYWWHNFFPDVIRQIISERLDMLPVNKQIGFFSDAYCVEWSYGKALMVRKILAQVLAARIEIDQYTLNDALSIARAILYLSPQSLLNIKPRHIE